MPVAEVAGALSVRERVLLFCIASATDWLLARITEETVIALLLKGLLQRDATGRLSLTCRGREVLRTMLPDLSRSMGLSGHGPSRACAPRSELLVAPVIENDRNF
jgi:hypothetical protein